MAVPQATQNTNDITSVIQQLAQRQAGKETGENPGGAHHCALCQNTHQ